MENICTRIGENDIVKSIKHGISENMVVALVENYRTKRKEENWRGKGSKQKINTMVI